MANHAVLK